MKKLRIALIGSSGHSIMYLPDQYMEDRIFTALAPGSSGESMDAALQKIKHAGYAPACYPDYRELLQKEKPDIVIVDNYYGEHFPVIMAAFQAGAHVIAESPQPQTWSSWSS